MHTPDVWFKSLHQNIGREFEKNIRHKEYNQRNVRLLANQAQLFRETHSERVGYVDSTATSTH